MNEDKPNQNEPQKISTHAEREERILRAWKEKGIFEKSVETPAGEKPKGEYTFYDGPPFATGLPHYGHILAGTIKDVIPRFKTMQGYRVRRRWGWDCHGLPVENLIEKELELATKKDIVTYGVGKFNEAARKSVMRYADEWRDIVPRLGRWVDMKNDYRTMDATYTESVWWIFKKLYESGLIYEGFKSMNLCPRCETTLSNFEVAQGYKDITDISVTVKFKVKKMPGPGEKDEAAGDIYLLAWTTTPWTLPGNVALAVNSEIEYAEVDVEHTEGKFIVALDRVKTVFNDSVFKVTRTIKGSDLVGTTYEPLFDYYSKDNSLKNKENGWKVYGAPFVTTEDGTGIVHIAPAFGADDYELLRENELPFVQHVTSDGRFKSEVSDFAGQQVKPKDSPTDKEAHLKADIEIIKWLAHKGKLFSKEKLVHSYPHCWRCETPLLNYAASSWFVKVTAIKDKLVAENKKVAWVPPEVGEGRFGNWLEGARDWAISRSRFWGAPIPVWKKKDEDGGGYVVMGSVSDIKKYSKAKNTYYVMRHGEAENNVLGVLSGDPKTPHHLTEKGKNQVKSTVTLIKSMKPDIIYVSPFVRTQDTAEIVRDGIGLGKEKVITDERIRELVSGSWNGRNVTEYLEHFAHIGHFDSHPDGVENYAEMKKRMGDFLYDLEKKHEGKTILIVTHENPAFLLISAAAALDRKATIEMRGTGDFMVNAEVRKLDFAPLPHNSEYELDLHRPYIDDIELRTPEGHKLERVPDVFDCWFESGAMPYGENHYPFAPSNGFHPKPSGVKGLFARSKGFPADFIAEGLDQTRGWFYSMMVLGVALFGHSPYKKVIVNGLVLAEDGEKMSKSKQNYPDPMVIVNTYGADSLRFYLLQSPVVRGQDLCFSEKGVDEVTKKIVNRLLNVVSFYEMYASASGNDRDEAQSTNVLDVWMMARLNELIGSVTEGLEAGELDRAARPLQDFVDDLSTWYLRRSRDRFKGEDENDRKMALATTRHALVESAKVIAPFMPFLAEEIYSRVLGKNAPKESVHLESWPKGTKGFVNSVNGISGAKAKSVISQMKRTRLIASEGLEARMNSKINVRQPLLALRVKDAERLDDEYVALVKDEVNVKDVLFGERIDKSVELDITMTPLLKEEGELRELVRKVQDMRKEKKLKVGDKATLVVPPEMEAISTKYSDVLKKTANLSSIEKGGTLEIKI